MKIEKEQKLKALFDSYAKGWDDMHTVEIGCTKERK